MFDEIFVTLRRAGIALETTGSWLCSSAIELDGFALSHNRVRRPANAASLTQWPPLATADDARVFYDLLFPLALDYPDIDISLFDEIIDTAASDSSSGSGSSGSNMRNRTRAWDLVNRRA